MQPICTFFAHEAVFDRIVEILKSTFPKASFSTGTEDDSQVISAKLRNGFLKPLTTIRLTHRQRTVPSYQLPADDSEPINANLRGLYNYISILPAKTTTVKDQLLQKIQTINAEFALMAEHAKDDDVVNLAAKLAAEFDAILFVLPDLPISKAPSQHMLDSSLRLILDAQGNSAVDNVNVTINSSHFDDKPQELTPDQQQRKEKSEALLRLHDVPINEWLPAIESEEETIIRSPKEIAQRLCVLSVVNMFAFNYITGEEAIAYLQQYALWQYATPDEMDLMTNPTDKKKMQETWKTEGIYVLFWALDVVGELAFPDSPVDMGSLGITEYPVGANTDPNVFINGATRSKSKTEILDANDLYYRADWACVDARMKDDLSMDVLDRSVVYERHYALNWLIHYLDQEWDDISCDT